MVKYCERLFLMNWKDKKEVRILSSISNGQYQFDFKGKPAVIHEYNRAIPGININDQMKFGRKVGR
jgi:hypothetical protein